MTTDTANSELSAEAMQAMTALTKRFPHPDGALLTALRIAEREVGFINPHVCEQVAEAIGMAPAKVWGVVSFYSTFRRDTDGKYIIYLCSTLPCALRGSERVFDHIASKLGIKNGETTADGKFTLRKAECLGSCGTAPCLQVNQAEYYEGLTTQMVDEIIEDLVNDKSPARHFTP